jgi:hypothetical protein
MHLVDDQRRGVTREECLRIVLGLLGFAGKVEGDEVVIGQRVPDEARLPRLPSTGDYDRRSLPGESRQRTLQLACHPHRA